MLMFAAAALSSSSQESTYSVERVPASLSKCPQKAGVMAPAAAATNLLSIKFKISVL